MFTILTSKLFTRLSIVTLLALTYLGLSSSLAFADVQSKSVPVKLTRGDFRTLTFVPGAAGQIKALATFKTQGLGKDVALRLQIRNPDGKVVAEQIGGDPLPASFSLSAAEFAKFKGKAWEVRLSHDAPGQPAKDINGDLKVTFPIATVTVFNNSANPIDVGGKGAQTEVKFKLPNTPGKLDVEINFQDGVFNGKQLTAQIVRQDGGIETTKVGTSGLKLSTDVSAADLATGLNWKVRLTNNNNTDINRIAVIVRITPK